MVAITKENFQDYQKCQSLGVFNMLDYKSWNSLYIDGQKVTNLTIDEWKDIIFRYSEYKEKFK